MILPLYSSPAPHVLYHIPISTYYSSQTITAFCAQTFEPLNALLLQCNITTSCIINGYPFNECVGVCVCVPLPFMVINTSHHAIKRRRPTFWVNWNESRSSCCGVNSQCRALLSWSMNFWFWVTFDVCKIITFTRQ